MLPLARSAGFEKTNQALRGHIPMRCNLHNSILTLLALAAQALSIGNQLVVDLNNPDQVATAKQIFKGKTTTRVAFMPEDKVFLSEIVGPIADGNPDGGKVTVTDNGELVVTAQQNLTDVEYSNDAGRALQEILEVIAGDDPEYALAALTDTEISFRAFRIGKRTGYAFQGIEINDQPVIDVQYNKDDDTFTLVTADTSYNVPNVFALEGLKSGTWDGIDEYKMVDVENPHALLRKPDDVEIALNLMDKSGATVPYNNEGPMIASDEAMIVDGDVRITLMPAIEDGWNAVYSGKVNGRELWGARLGQQLADLIPVGHKFGEIYGKTSEVAPTV